jgi:hypothetical protein
MADPDREELLHRHTPQLIYDSQETYFADSAAEWTDAPGNTLKREDGTVLAAAKPGPGQAQLSLDFLRAGRYASRAKVSGGDAIGHATKDYLESYRALHPQERYRNRIYGRAVDGEDNLWLQYWFFYYYNDAPVRWIGYGKHEGDWEMIQLRIDGQGRPDLAVYAQHKEAGVREWVDVQKAGNGDTPLVYVARAAHASYFAPGNHWNDRADGGRPGPPLALEIVTDTAPAWIAWPGRWGDTKAASDLEGQSSPTGPCRHAQWQHPDELIARSVAAADRAPAPPGPTHPQMIRATRADDRARISYAFPGDDLAGATQLLVTVNSPDDPFPPVTYDVPIDKPSGTVEAPLALEDDRRYEIRVSAANDHGATTSAVRRDLLPRAVRTRRGGAARGSRRRGSAAKPARARQR